MHAYMSVFVHVCMGIYMYVYMYVKGHVGTYRCNVCACKYMYTYLGLYGCVYVCTSIRVCMKRHRVFMQSVCIQIQSFMSVFVSCLRVCFKCVCRCIHIYRYARKTPWTHTDTLCAHRNTCIRICVCACVFMYTHVYIYI